LSDARDLNFQAVEHMIDMGFTHEYILDSLIQSMDAYSVNDQFSFIYRMNEIEGSISEELDTYDKDSEN